MLYNTVLGVEDTKNREKKQQEIIKFDHYMSITQEAPL